MIEGLTFDIENFQKLILEDKIEIGLKVEKLEKQQGGFARVERTKKILEEAGLSGLEMRPQELMINNTQIEVDLLLADKKTALKVIEPVKIPHDLRFFR